MLLLLLGPALANPSPVTFVPEAQVRPRIEADSGRDGVNDAGNVGFVTMRTRLGATLSRDDVAVRVVVQDVRFFGEEQHPRFDFSADGFDLRIGTLTWSPGDWSFEIGRMERGLYNERLLAIANWRQPGRSNDGARITWANGGWSLDVRGFLQNEGDSTDITAGDQVVPIGNDAGTALLTFGYADDAQSLHPLVFVDISTGLDSRTQRATPGFYGTLTRGNWFLEAEAYGQFGLENDVATTAAMVGLRGTWTASDATTLGLAYDLLSGDGDPTDDVDNAFMPLQGANHRYYGHVDMALFKVGGPNDGQGLQDVQLFGRQRLTDQVELRVDLHSFFFAAPDDEVFLAFEPDTELRVALADGLGWSNGVFLWLPGGDAATEWMAYSMFDARL
jgi:hypothetical protein